MSRLIVKNIPSSLTPDRLREHFERKDGPGGTITDIQVAKKRDGTSRRFGFVGFKTEKEAEKAKEWFDRTFIDSSRIVVNLVEDILHTPAPWPNKRPRLESSVNEENTAPTKTKTDVPLNLKPSDKGKAPEDPLTVFYEVMKPRTKKGPLWSNDVDVDPKNAAMSSSKAGQKSNVSHKRAELKEPEEELRNEALSDMDWLKQRMSKTVKDLDKAYEQSDEEAEIDVRDEKQDTSTSEGEKDPIEKTILQTGRLFVRNLTFSCTDVDLTELFKPFGEITQIHIPLDPLSKQSKGLAYVRFAQPSCASAAYKALDRKSFQGRLLHILAAVERSSQPKAEETDGKKSVKDKKTAQKKALAGRDFNWSMLYMNSDAVVSSIADRMNISKADIFNPDSDNAAVKLALAETHIIQETKSYLESQGVILSTFSSRARSDTTILVKNIPYGTTAEQIREMFEVHGELDRVLVPPAGTMAAVEFVRADEASKAFRAIAYRRLGNSVIYLEKGPLGMFQPAEDGARNGPKVSTASEPIRIPEQADSANAEDEEPPSLSAGTTLFVKNLSFSTTTERLTQVFRHLPSFSFARVQTKPDPKHASHPGGPAPRLSMGYGFVGFKDLEAAKKALKSIQDFVLDGHALHVKFAGRGTEEDVDKTKVSSKSRTTKMIVKNIPFEATKKDIRALFSAHGQLKSVRLPRRFDSRTRGFAFLEFVTRHDAENAYAALRHTHLLGRHLVLEWAEEGEQDIDALRHKAGVGFGDGAEMPGRKRKMEFGEGDNEGEQGEL